MVLGGEIRLIQLIQLIIRSSFTIWHTVHSPPPPPTPSPQHSAALPSLFLPSGGTRTWCRVRLERIGRTPSEQTLQIARGSDSLRSPGRAGRMLRWQEAPYARRAPGPRPPSAKLLFSCFSTFSGANTSNCRVTPKI